MVLSGPPGVGKSAVLAQVRRDAVNCTVLAATGVESESELAYASLHQLLRPLAQLNANLPLMQREALEAALGSGEGSAEPMRVGLGALGILADAAEQATVVCLLDDVQWFDSASRKALAFAIRRLNAERIAVVGAQRVSPDSSRFAHEIAVEEVSVLPLTESQETELLTGLAGTPVTHDIGRRIHASTAGFPLATVALTKLLTADQLKGLQPLPNPLPVGTELRSIFDMSLRGLPEPARQLLLVAAADDSGMAGAVLRAMKNTTTRKDMLGVLETADLISLEGGLIAFKHPLVRSVVYQSASPNERRTAHNSLAAAHAEMGAHERHVWHRALGAVPPDQAIARELAETARGSDARSAHAAAAAGYELAASLSNHRDMEAQMLVAAAKSAWQAGHLDHASSLAQRVRPLATDPMLVSELDFVQGGIHLGRGQTETAYELLLTAGQRVVSSDVDQAIRIWALASESVSYAGDRVAAARLADAVASLELSNLSPTQKLYLRMIVGIGHLFGDEQAMAVAQFRLALDETGSVSRVVDLSAAARVAMYLGDDQQSISLSVQAVETAKAQGTVAFIPMTGGRLSLIEVMTSQFTLALATADETIRLTRDTDQPQLGVQCLCWYALVMAYRGQTEECHRLVTEAREIMQGKSLGSVADALIWVEGALELSLGDAHAANQRLTQIDHPGIWIMATLDIIESAGHPTADQPNVVGQAAEYASATAQPWAMARVAHGRALMSEGSDAEADFAEALMHHDQSQRHFERARTHLAFGSWLRRNRRRRDAREQLQAAHAIFESLGASPWQERAQAGIRATGGTSRLRDTLVYDQLTPQEVQVARLITEGMTNRDAATHLFLSPRTVEYHLRNIYTKLGITSRTELARLDHEGRLASKS